MKKNVEYEYIEIDDSIPENIEVQSVLKDRIIFKHIMLKSKRKSSIIDPMTGKPVENTDHLDRWGLRGEVVFAGEDAVETEPLLKPGATFFLEDQNATWGMLINGKAYGVTRLSNVFLIYKEKAKK